MHRILSRQIQRYLGDDSKMSPDLLELLNAISETYTNFDEDQAMLDRSLSLSSAEFLENNRKLQEAKQKIEEKVRDRTLELEKQTARLLSSIECLSMGFAILENEGRIFYLNALFKKMLSLPQVYDMDGIETGLNKKFSLKELFDESLTEQTSVSKIIPFDNKFLRIFVNPIVLHSKVIGGVVLIEDATQEQQIDRAKSEFVALASHQLRTPLTIVKWYVEIMRKKVKIKPELKFLEKYLAHIDEGTKRMVALVQALLNVSRIEIGKLGIKAVDVDFVALCQNMIDELKPDIAEKKLVINQVFQPELPHIKADPDLLRIIVQNLLTNAIKYTPESGMITLTLKKESNPEFSRKSHSNPDFFLLSVSDTGLGIPKDEQSKIFTKLYRADNIKLVKASGTGLGLYITKSIVDAFGGVIWFESPYYGRGSIFYVALPPSVAVKEGITITAGEDNLLYS